MRQTKATLRKNTIDCWIAIFPGEERWRTGRALRERIQREKHSGRRAEGPPRSCRSTNQIEPNTPARPRADPLRPHAYLRVRILARVGGGDGIRPVVNPENRRLAQACGDRHLMNFGAFATPERQPHLRHQ